MSTPAQPNDRGADPRVTAVEVTNQLIVAHLVFGDGTGIRWPDVEEDLSVRGMLEGAPARHPPR